MGILNRETQNPIKNIFAGINWNDGLNQFHSSYMKNDLERVRSFCEVIELKKNLKIKPSYIWCSSVMSTICDEKMSSYRANIDWEKSVMPHPLPR